VIPPEVLEPIRDAPRNAGLFVDFDGVVAEIVATHDRARPRPAVPDLLARLSTRLGRVAVVSGRPVSYLTAWLPDEIDLVGLYGLEARTDGRHETWPEAEAWRATMSVAAEAATARFTADSVEPKGLSLTVHYRDRDETGPEVERWAEERARETGLDVRHARKSVELHPPVDRDKGTAVIELAAGLDSVVFMGDDIGDLPAFDALDHLATSGVSTLRVGVESSESPPDLLTRADLIVPGPEGAEQFLRTLLESLATAPKRS